MIHWPVGIVHITSWLRRVPQGLSLHPLSLFPTCFVASLSLSLLNTCWHQATCIIMLCVIADRQSQVSP
eukprot:15435508-Alexandrium_andersonii.AAC.1